MEEIHRLPLKRVIFIDLTDKERNWILYFLHSGGLMKNPVFAVMLFSSFAFLCSPVKAKTDLEKLPPAFETRSGRAIFADFKEAHYEIIYDLKNERASVKATISLETIEAGKIIFDSHSEPTQIRIDGFDTGASLESTPDRSSVVRVLNLSRPKGNHVLEVNLPLEKVLDFSPEGVKSAFWMGDLEDRNYIEKYLPTNYIFDRVPMIFTVRFLGGANQRIYTNGKVTPISSEEYRVVFEDGYNITCPYFHTTPVGSFTEREFTFESLDGRKLPGLIYIPRDEADPVGKLDRLEANTVKFLNELEGDYGPFPHQSITIYNNGPSGGMEYSGATITSESALAHELFHSYFARGVMPADGNSGWLDEALARWRDRGYSRISTLEGSTKMANQGTYARLTDRAAYTFGERFMSYLDGKLKDAGGLKPFLRHLVKTKSFDPITTEDFIEELRQFFGIDFTRDFKERVYGEGSGKLNSENGILKRDAHLHGQLNETQLRHML